MKKTSIGGVVLAAVSAASLTQASELPYGSIATQGFRSQANVEYVAPSPEGKRAKLNGRSPSTEVKLVLDNLFSANSSKVILAAQGNELFYERYSFGTSRRSTPLSFSISKSLTALTVGRALCDGHITSLEDQLKKYVRDLEGTSWGESTIRNVLKMASGANSTDLRLNGWNNRATGDDLNEVYNGRLRIDYIDVLRRNDEKRFASGVVFNYSNFDTIALGLLVQNATRGPFPAYFEKTVWEDVGAESRGAWIINGRKQTATYAGFSATPHDWIRVGLMVLRELKNQESCYGKFLKEAVSEQILALGPASGYGCQIWQNCGPNVDFCFIGYGGQYLLFNVENDIVLYHHATTSSPTVFNTPYVMSALLQALRSNAAVQR